MEAHFTGESHRKKMKELEKRKKSLAKIRKLEKVEKARKQLSICECGQIIHTTALTNHQSGWLHKDQVRLKELGNICEECGMGYENLYKEHRKTRLHKENKVKLQEYKVEREIASREEEKEKK